MPYTVEYNPAKHLITVAIHGELNLPVLQSVAAEVSKIIQEFGCKMILNDLREAHPADKTLEIYNMPKTAQQSGVLQSCRRALIVGDRAADFYFLETVFRNQGHVVRMFENPDDAEKWLFSKTE